MTDTLSLSSTYHRVAAERAEDARWTEFHHVAVDCGTLLPRETRAFRVVVRNRAFSVNYADVCVRWGLYESALRYVGWPIVPGFDLAGVVESAGRDTSFSPGDRVFGCSFFGWVPIAGAALCEELAPT